MGLCAACGVRIPGNGTLCAHHVPGSCNHWAENNRLMCDLLHRGRVPSYWQILLWIPVRLGEEEGVVPVQHESRDNGSGILLLGVSPRREHPAVEGRQATSKRFVAHYLNQPARSIV